MASNVIYLGVNSPVKMDIDLDEASETIDLCFKCNKEEMSIDLNLETAEVLCNHIAQLVKELRSLKN